MDTPFNPKDYVMYLSSLEDASVAYHFEQFKYRRANIQFGIVDLTDGMYAVMEERTREEKGWRFIEPPELNFLNLDFDQLDDIYCRSNHPILWHHLEKALNIMDRDLLIFIATTGLPFERMIRHSLARSSVNAENRFVGKEEAYALWNTDTSEPLKK